jgi:DNA-directed RNA polymerase subunit RPC12/RpoP
MSLRKYVEKWKIEHRCVNCGRQLDNNYMYTKCEKCRETSYRCHKRWLLEHPERKKYHNNVLLTKKRHQNRDEHKCWSCGKPLDKGWTHLRCQDCFLKHKFDNQLYRMRHPEVIKIHKEKIRQKKMMEIVE